MQSRPQTGRRRAAFAVLAVLVTVALSACSATSNSNKTSTSSGTLSSYAKSKLAASYKGDLGTPPTTAAKPKKGVTAWIVSCGQSVPSCAAPTAGFVQAAKAVGWTAKVCDGQLNPNGWGNCIRQAASAKADVVFPIGIDCASVEAPMEAAVKAGVKIIGAGASDCTATGGKKVLSTERLQLANTSIKQYWENAGKVEADWLIGKTNGMAKVLALKFTDPVWGPWLYDGFAAEIKSCSGCTILKTLGISNADTGNGQMTQKFSSALVQATNANAVWISVGGWMSGGLSSAIQSSGKAGKLAVATGFGDASNMDLIRKADYTLGTLGYATPWGAYGSVDEAIRVLDGQQPVVEGDGYQMVDKTHNLPASGDYNGNVDYKAAYLKLWGVS